MSNYYLALLLGEYLRQMDEGIAAAYDALADQTKITPLRVWRPWPSGPIAPQGQPTADTPPEQWEWNENQKGLPALAALEAAIGRFRWLVDQIEGGQSES